jgi:hypothetical protein
VLYIALWLIEWCDRCVGVIQSDGSYLNGMPDASEWCDRSVGVIQSDGSYLNSMTVESMPYGVMTVIPWHDRCSDVIQSYDRYLNGTTDALVSYIALWLSE